MLQRFYTEKSLKKAILVILALMYQKYPKIVQMAFWVNFRYKNVATHIFHRIWSKFGGIYVLQRFYSEKSLKKAFLGLFLA